MAAAWSVGGTGGGRLLALATNLVLTRLLAPEAFGLMAIVTATLMLVNLVSDIGILQSVVRDPRGEEPRFLRVAWTVQVARSGVIAGMVLGIAGALAALAPRFAPEGSVYAEPQLPGLVAAAAGAVLLQGLNSTGLFRAARRLDTRTPTLIEIGAQAVGMVVTIGLAWGAGWGVWSLMTGTLVGAAVSCAATHALFRDVPMGFAWDRGIAGEMWRFGRWIIGSSAAGFVVNSGDRFILGALMDAETFSLYAIALLWFQAGYRVIQTLASKVVFSAQAEVLRADRARFPAVFRRIRRVFDALIVLVFAVAFFGADLLMGLLYPPLYQGAAVFLSLRSLRYLVERSAPLRDFHVAEGRSAVQAATFVLSAVTLVVAVPLAWRWGGDHAAVIAVALAPLTGVVLTTVMARRHMPDLPLRGDIPVVAALLLVGAAAYLWAGA